jgi:phenylacetate-coenzyme A ligase PaaK-like adenylate-forming protein
VRYAVGTSRYYREVLGPDAINLPLTELPTLTKATLMARFDDIVTDSRLRLDTLRTHLAGPQAGAPYAGYHLVTTSGSTGEPGVFLYSGEEMRVAQTALARAMSVIGLRPVSRLAGIGAAGAVHLSRHLVGRPGGWTRARSAAPVRHHAT